jgi:hypothetical protein
VTTRKEREAREALRAAEARKAEVVELVLKEIRSHAHEAQTLAQRELVEADDALRALTEKETGR